MKATKKTKSNNGTVTVQLDRVRETQNFILFDEVRPEGVMPIVGKVYINKATAKKLGDRVTLTVS
jgi:hypothetical protein